MTFQVKGITLFFPGGFEAKRTCMLSCKVSRIKSNYHEQNSWLQEHFSDLFPHIASKINVSHLRTNWCAVKDTSFSLQVITTYWTHQQKPQTQTGKQRKYSGHTVAASIQSLVSQGKAATRRKPMSHDLTVPRVTSAALCFVLAPFLGQAWDIMRPSSCCFILISWTGAHI